MKRMAIALEQIAVRDNLLLATERALHGTGRRSAAGQTWLAALDANLQQLSESILQERAPSGASHRFTLFDPKRRDIVAPCFSDRVLHHAIVNLSETQFEHSLVPSSFACRPGKGIHAAVPYVQNLLRRFPVWTQVDVQHYFPNIDHVLMLQTLETRFKGKALLDLWRRIFMRGATGEVGLPIGALTSQHCANLFLSSIDRWLLAQPAVLGHARYMDDIVWFSASKKAAAEVLGGLHERIGALKLRLKAETRQGFSARGMRFCGFRIKPGVVLASARKLRRYRLGMQALAAGTDCEHVTPAQLQRAADVQTARLAHTEALHFRRRVCRRLNLYDRER